MKRLLCILLALVMVLAMAGCSKEGPSDSSSGKEEETESLPVTESGSEAETGTQPEPQMPASPSADSGLLPLSVMLGSGYLSEWSQDHAQLAYTQWDEVYLESTCAGEYRQLMDALAYVNRSFRGWGDTNHLALTERAKTAAAQLGESFAGYEARNRVCIQRADSRVFSLLSQRIVSDGQAMGLSYTYEGVNLDSATGMQVTIDLVLTDMDSLPQLLEDALTKKYADYPEGAFAGMADKLKGYGPRDYKWTISYQGVTFYFDEQELLTPHHGGVSVTLWFADHPDLFVEAYTQFPENGYALTLPLNADVEVDLLPGDGKTDRLYLALDADQNLKVEVNQSRYQEEWFGYYMEAYLVTTDNRNFYLYLVSHADSDYSVVHVYALMSGELVPLTELNSLDFEDVRVENPEYGETYYGLVFNDPSRFSLYTHAYMLSTVASSRFYHTDPKTGIPQPETDYYTMNPDMPPLISKISLTVKMLPDETDAVLPSGTKFYFLRTDNETYVDMGLEDGRECRIYLVRQDWEWFVDGHSEYDCFENLMYAG